ncbi:MAG: hypothetical protein Q4C34_06480 [Bacteroidales bacterium]|nr:hypothetical protein [Bacteroidales bacterium]
MTLQKFNLPVEIVDLISTLEPQYQGEIYMHLFAYIYHGVPVPDDVDPRCRLILKLLVERIAGALRRARGARARARYKGGRHEPPQRKIGERRDWHNSSWARMMVNDSVRVAEESMIRDATRRLPPARHDGVPPGRPYWRAYDNSAVKQSPRDARYPRKICNFAT